MMDYSGGYTASTLGTQPIPKQFIPSVPPSSIQNPLDNLVNGMAGGLISAIAMFAWPAILVGAFALILVALVVGLGGFSFGLILGDDS